MYGLGFTDECLAILGALIPANRIKAELGKVEEHSAQKCRTTSNILSFEFLQNEYVDLNVKEFKSIQIAIMDVTGNSVKTDSSTPTRLQLMFSTV